jgi:TRAP-type C4-dicarboxylate transport system permease small subunit
MSWLENLVRTLDSGMRRLLDMLIVLMSGGLLVLLVYAVFARFVLNASVSWGEELPAHVLAALTFIGAAYLTRTNEHLGFDGVIRAVRPAVQRAVLAVNLLLMGAFGGLLAYFGGLAVMSFGDRMLISVDLPVALFRGAMPLGGALIALICFLRLIGLLTGRVTCEDLIPEGEG